MKKWIAVLAVLILLCGVAPLTAFAEEAVTYNLAECAEDVKLIGRTEVTDNAIVPHTTASGIAFYTDCEGDIEMEAFGKNNYFTCQYFAVYVDGVMTSRVKLDHRMRNRTVTDTVTIAEELDGGMHRIEIYKETEEVDAYCEWRSITLSGKMYPVPQAPMLIEFVGDSITTGYGAYPYDYDTDNQTVNRQAGTKSYAFLTAAELGMDIQVCCTSGYGAEVGYNQTDVNMQDMYEYTAYHHDHASEDAKWAFDRKADVVVINLGTNDNGASRQKGVSEKQVLKGMKNLMEIARRCNPDASIVWCTGMMGTTFKKGLENIVDELGGAECGYYFCVLPQNTKGGGGHPDEQGHIDAAKTLTAFLLENVLADDYAEQYVTVEDMESLLAESKKLDDTVRATAQAEITAANAAGNTYCGTLTALYRGIEATQTQASQNVMDMVIIVAVLIVGAAVVVLVAVFYRPKKKETVAE